MSTNKNKTLIAEFKTKLLNDQKNLRATIDELVKNTFKVIFENHPEINEITINTWIPGFNDGEPCEFSTNFSYPYVNGKDSGPLAELVSEYLGEIDKLVAQMFFGTNVEVVITKDSISISDYDCGY
jgi:hypothetical protein